MLYTRPVVKLLVRFMVVGEAFVVAQVEVGFRTVLGRNLAVLERASWCRIDVDVGIEFEQGDF